MLGLHIYISGASLTSLPELCLSHHLGVFFETPFVRCGAAVEMVTTDVNERT